MTNNESVDESEISDSFEEHSDTGMFDILRKTGANSSQRPLSPPDVDNHLTILHEINHYLSSGYDSKFKSSSQFWRDAINSNMYPHLKELVKVYHSTPSAAAETERLFSIAKLILSDLRKRLLPENFEKLLFLHNNLMIFNYNY